jgi:uncharacterized membrane protein HdeD (DUF308 family)
MGKSTTIAEFEQRIEDQFGLTRGLLLAVGVACVSLGLVAIALPLSLFGSLIWMVGLILLGSGAVKAIQLLLGRRSRTARERGWPVIVLQVAIDLLMGLLLLNHVRASAGVAALLFGLLFLVEGLIVIYMALRSPKVESRRALLFAGLVTAGIGLAIVLGLVAQPLRWAGIFVGLKLLLFGGTLTWIAARAPKSDGSLIYEAWTLVPETAELHAVYFGTAFHLGVSIGDGEVVHYLNDNHVYRTTWDKFLDGRTPEHWTYPDLEPIPPDVVVSTALSEVGKTYPYNLLTFNCEHFAVFCKSGGKTRYSKYAQVAGGVETVHAHPMIGLVAELNTRFVEWLAFHFGGPAGKRLSLAIRRIGAAVTAWLISPGRTAVAERPE